MEGFMKNKNNIIIFIGLVCQFIALILIILNMAQVKDKLKGTNLEKYINDENIARSFCVVMISVSVFMSCFYLIRRWNNLDSSSTSSRSDGEEYRLQHM